MDRASIRPTIGRSIALAAAFGSACLFGQGSSQTLVLDGATVEPTAFVQERHPIHGPDGVSK
jgi:hypothetical protein